REEGVANESHAVLIEDQSDMSERVSGHFDDSSDVPAESDPIAFVQRDIPTGNIFTGGPGDPCAGRSLDREIAAGVIRVPVRVPDLVDRPAAPLGFGEHGSRVAGIDDSGFAAVLVVDEPQVIVAERGDRDDFHRRGHYAGRWRTASASTASLRVSAAAGS